jgi:hypothetical protein
MGNAKSGELVWQAGSLVSDEKDVIWDAKFQLTFENVDAADPCLPANGHSSDQLFLDSPLEAIASDSAGLALWSLRQLGDHLDVAFDLTEDLLRMQERRIREGNREADSLLVDLGRVQDQLLRCKDEVQGGINSLEPGIRDASKALGMADSLVARLDLLVTKVEEIIADAAQGGSDAMLLEGLERAAEELLSTHQEAAVAFLEIFEATW